MQALRLKNLRSFADTGDVQLKDINLFVGQNSSGKSTLLRTFPLIRQSILRDTRGPILWYDDTLVDFGSYSEAKNRYSSEKEGIHFGFKLKISTDNKRHFIYDTLKIKEEILININIEIFENNKQNYIGNITINLDGQEISIEANQNGALKTFKINNRIFNFTEGTHNLIKIESTGLIPLLLIFNKNEKYINKEHYLNKCRENIKNIIGNRLKDVTRIDRIIRNVIIGSKETMLQSLKSQTSITTWNKKIEHWDLQTDEFNELNDLLIAHYSSSILNTIDEKLKSYFEECKYIAPIRAKAIRYYRRQDLSISEVDAYGDNLHMFLDNLNVKQTKSYQEFVSNVFQFTPLAESSQGHITINIKDSNGATFNLTDLGFGYSQILPIITKLWYAFSEKEPKKRYWEKARNIVTLLIEQPELHLHPAMQAQLADAFIYAIESARKNGIQLKLIIETHSPVIINRIGRRITENKIDPSTVNVTLFQLDDELKNSIIKTANFNNNGVLQNWPLGFFEPKK